MWVLVVAAAALTIRARQQGRLSGRWNFHAGLVLAGWGVFNIVEGLVNHQLLQIHHVRDDLGGPLAWDLGFLGVSVALAVGGWLLFRGSPTSGKIGTPDAG
jgi:uncharacterized membrane protein